MQFGLALAVADALECDERIAGVWLDAIDTGRPMMELGKRLWQALASEVGSRAGLLQCEDLSRRLYELFWPGGAPPYGSI